jgi:putative component of toxin-antitoxin plasmid stabilization module
MTEGGWDVEFYADENGREPCREWAEGLSPTKKAAFLAALEVVLIPQGINVASNEFGKSLGGGLYELRIRQTATEIRQRVAALSSGEVDYPPEAVLLRIFFCTAGRKLIMLMSGYDKGENSSERRQNREIENARRLMRAHAEQRSRAAKTARRQPRSR